MDENTIGTRLIEAAIEVHRELGPGLLESVYEPALAYELEQHGLQVARQVPVSLNYKGIHFDEGFRADLIIEDKVIAELKSVEQVTPAHKKQTQTYLRLTGNKLGYLLNFGGDVMKTGITRCVNGLPEKDSAPLRPCAPARTIRRAGGRAVNWRRHCDLAQRRRGAEIFAMEEHF
jgi:GxxExxY protein